MDYVFLTFLMAFSPFVLLAALIFTVIVAPIVYLFIKPYK